ncbi:MAG: hypothetical protein AAF917_15260, partial [Pseudomonadota bacterium]
MDIAQALNDLGPVNIDALSSCILAFDDSEWLEERVRQEKYSDVHYNTESIIAVFCDHDDWPNIDVVKGQGWDKLSDAALPVMHDIIRRH